MTYAWGPDWDDTLTNTDESRLDRSVAVGLYPRGSSPVGALDMSGGVWEWCLNEFSEITSVGVGGNNLRTLRGGSFHHSQEQARSNYREHYHRPQRGRDYDVGFRLARHDIAETPMP